MKSLKALLTYLCYFGAGLVAIEELTGFDIPDKMNLNPVAQNIIWVMFVVFWSVKIAWFAYDKFYLERKERLQKMDIEKKGAETPNALYDKDTLNN